MVVVKRLTLHGEAVSRPPEIQDDWRQRRGSVMGSQCVSLWIKKPLITSISILVTGKGWLLG
jgi:hypothetical protein